MRHASGRVLRYIVQSEQSDHSRRFVADLPACLRDECADRDAAGALKVCLIKLDTRQQHKVNGRSSVDAWLRHTRTHCHGWHRDKVSEFAASVAETYGSYRRPRLVPARCWIPRPMAQPSIIAELLGWTIEDVRAEIARASA